MLFLVPSIRPGKTDTHRRYLQKGGRKERRKGVRRKKSSLEKGILNACGRSSAGRLCLTSGEPWDKQGVEAKRRSEKREPERPCPLSPRAPTSAGAWVGVAGHWGQGRVWACG